MEHLCLLPVLTQRFGWLVFKHCLRSMKMLFHVFISQQSNSPFFLSFVHLLSAAVLFALVTKNDVSDQQNWQERGEKVDPTIHPGLDPSRGASAAQLQPAEQTLFPGMVDVHTAATDRFPTNFSHKQPTRHGDGGKHRWVVICVVSLNKCLMFADVLLAPDVKAAK